MPRQNGPVHTSPDGIGPVNADLTGGREQTRARGNPDAGRHIGTNSFALWLDCFRVAANHLPMIYQKPCSGSQR